MSAAAKSAWLKASERCWYNASGLYREAAISRAALESARETVADLLTCDPAQIVFTSGATESNNAIFRGIREVHSQRAIAVSSV